MSVLSNIKIMKQKIAMLALNYFEHDKLIKFSSD